MHAHYFISVKLTFVFGSIRQIVGDDNVGNSNNSQGTTRVVLFFLF